MAKIPFNQDVDETIAKQFAAQVEERGYMKYRAVEGALRAFICLPADVQVKLMSPELNDSQDITDLLIGSQIDHDEFDKLWQELSRIAKKVGVKLKK